jgi:hypothetical protein
MINLINTTNSNSAIGNQYNHPADHKKYTTGKILIDETSLPQPSDLSFFNAC